MTVHSLWNHNQASHKDAHILADKSKFYGDLISELKGHTGTVNGVSTLFQKAFCEGLGDKERMIWAWNESTYAITPPNNVSWKAIESPALYFLLVKWSSFTRTQNACWSLYQIDRSFVILEFSSGKVFIFIEGDDYYGEGEKYSVTTVTSCC